MFVCLFSSRIWSTCGFWAGTVWFILDIFRGSALYINQKVSNVNIAKGTTDPRIEFISQVITQILIKQFHNFNQALTSKSQLNISILTKLKLKILVKVGSSHVYLLRCHLEGKRKVRSTCKIWIKYCLCCSTCREFDGLHQLKKGYIIIL